MGTLIKGNVRTGRVSAMDARNGLPVLQFERGSLNAKVPLLFSETRCLDALELNEFLLSLANAGQLTESSLLGKARTLLRFLDWLETDYDVPGIYSVSLSSDAGEWVPYARYCGYISNRVANGNIKDQSAKLYIAHVRQFYRWAADEGRVRDSLMDKPVGQPNVVQHLRSTLDHPGFNAQKPAPGGDSAEQSIDVNAILKACNKLPVSAMLWVKLALQAGLNASDIVSRKETDITKPTDEQQGAVIECGEAQKRQVVVPCELMRELVAYKHTPERIFRLTAFKEKYPNERNAPLFINRSGEALNKGSITNVASQINKIMKPSAAIKVSFDTFRKLHVAALINGMDGTPMDKMKSMLKNHLGINRDQSLNRYFEADFNTDTVLGHPVFKAALFRKGDPA